MNCYTHFLKVFLLLLVLMMFSTVLTALTFAELASPKKVEHVYILNDSTPLLKEKILGINLKKGGYLITYGKSKILVFSDNGKITEIIPPALARIIDLYSDELIRIKDSIDKTENTILYSSEDEVEPLLKVDGKENLWGQGYPYNKFTPVENGENSWIGCGALSTGQIMWFWQHPGIGKGSRDGISFEETFYRWDLMPEKLNENSTTEEIDAVATMLYHVGVAIDMRYHYPEESLTHPSNIAPALGDQEEYGEIEPGFFKYNAVYDDAFFGIAGASQTATVLITELNAGRPVQFNALKPAGHGFVCDGYDSRGETDPLNYYFHFNFGWNGDYNGYFLLSAIGPVHETDITFIPNYKIIKEIYPIIESCDDTICSGHGECIDNAGVPECICDHGYYADEFYRCIVQNMENSDKEPDVNDDNADADDTDYGEEPENDNNEMPDTAEADGVTDDDDMNENETSEESGNEIVSDEDETSIKDDSQKKSDGCSLTAI